MSDAGGHGDIGKLLRDTAEAIRPHIEAALDLTEVFADYRKAVTDAGGDWMALKNLVKAQIQDERDDAGDGKHVARIIAKADFAASYADMLGLGSTKMNENNSFSDPVRSAEEITSKPTPAKALEAVRPAERIIPDHVADVGNMLPDTEYESPRAPTSHVAKALRDDAQPEGGMAGGSRPPITDRHGLMLDDIPANLRRARA